MKKRTLCSLVVAAMVTVPVSGVLAGPARQTIAIVGSSTVYPFATTVAERFGKMTRFKTPTIESTGSGGGFKLFCQGTGLNTPDITNASRRIKASEFKQCQDSGVTEITEVKIGYDGIVIANAKQAPLMRLTKKDIYLALAREVPDPKGGRKLVQNPYTRWNQVNPELPELDIEVLGPPPTSGTRDAFVELAMQGGCKEIPWLKELKKKDKSRFKEICETVREDGAFIEAGENDNLIVQKLVANPYALGIFGFSFLDQNRDKIQGALIEGQAPTFENIAAGTYPVSRPLFFYVKNSHVGMVPGISEYIDEFTSERAWGDEGYLADKGLIPMPVSERRQYRENARQLRVLVLDGQNQ